MMHTSGLLRTALALALATALAGCAASTSLNSISESSGSVSSISRSITSVGSSSLSSLGGEESAALERDVETSTALVTERGGDADAVLRDVGALCEGYALTDWEAEPAVQRGIARGLAAAGLPASDVERFSARASGPEPAVRDALRDALRSRSD